MLNWLNSVAGPNYASAILWTFAALVLLVFILIIVKLIRNLTFGTFVSGGRNRKTRLAVMDATAVDSHRRLVLVRRDDIEHLLLIGGPTDVVVERDIRLVAPRRPVLTGDNGQPQPAPAQKPRAPQAPAAAPSRQAPARQQAAAPPPAQIREPTPTPRPAPRQAPEQPLQLPAYGASNGQARPNATKVWTPASRDAIDDTLMDELEITLDDTPPGKPAVKAPAPSLDEEMTKLLGELANHKR